MTGSPLHDRALGPQRAVGQAVRRLNLQVEAYVRALARRTHHHASDLHALGVVTARAEGEAPVGPSALGRTLGLSPAAISALVDRMEEADHVTRERGGRDGRRVGLASTPHGRDQSRAHFAGMTRRYDAVLGDYTPAQLALVIEVLDRLAAASAAATTELAVQPEQAPRGTD